MEKKLLFALTLTLAWQWGVTAKGLNEYHDSDSDLAYTMDDNDYNDFTKFLGVDGKKSFNYDDTFDTPESKIKTSGFKKKQNSNKGVKSQHGVDDLNKFFKIGSSYDDEDYSNDDRHEISEEKAVKAVKVKGDEERKYRKGTKTRGFHHVQHKDEYKKDKEFYKNDETSGTIKKKGLKGLGLAFDAGTDHNERSYHSDHNKALHGKQGYYDKGRSSKQNKAYSDSQGYNSYFDSE